MKILLSLLTLLLVFGCATREGKIKASAITLIKASLRDPSSLKLHDVYFDEESKTPGVKYCTIDFSAANGLGGMERSVRAFKEENGAVTEIQAEFIKNSNASE